MADEELVRILTREGVQSWNEWRKQNLQIEPDLSGADLRELTLARANLSRVNLTGAHLRKTRLEGAHLRRANLSTANLKGAILSKANLERAYLTSTDLSIADLNGANLSRADLSGALLFGADLSNTNLTWTSLYGCDLSTAILRKAHLINTVFFWSILDGADLSNSRMGSTNLAGVNLSKVSGLETIEHYYPSTIGLDTIYLSGGNIPDVFVRRCGVPEDFITYMKSLVGKAIEFYSCFISYSNKDHEFAERLNADLQSKGVRCWFAPEDLKIGDKFRTRIEESIRLYDKVIVVLSENSIQSSWVEEEVEAALEKESQHPGTTVLFPIRLDDAVMEAKQAWAASLRRTRHIGEFSNWKNHDRYKKAFDRLLRDLKAEDKVHSSKK